MALVPVTTPIAGLLGSITLPPTPSASHSLPQHKQAVDVWTRKAQQTINQIARTLTALDTSLVPTPGTGTGGLYWSQALFDAAFAGKTTDDLAEGVSNLYWSQALFDTAFAAKTTDDLPEGITNLYWTTALFNTAFAAAFGPAFSTAFAAETTDSLAQGVTNLYFTSSAARAVLSATSPLLYNSSTGVFSIQQSSGSQAGFLSAADWTTFNTGASTATSAAAAAAAAQSTANTAVTAAAAAQATANAALPAVKQTKSVVLCSAYTPLLTGADTAEVEMPYDTTGSSLTFAIRRLLVRVQTAGGAPSVTFEQSSGSGAFSATAIGTVTLTSGANEGQNTTSLGTIASGSKMRFNVVALGTAMNWTIQADISAN